MLLSFFVSPTISHWLTKVNFNRIILWNLHGVLLRMRRHLFLHTLENFMEYTSVKAYIIWVQLLVYSKRKNQEFVNFRLFLLLFLNSVTTSFLGSNINNTASKNLNINPCYLSFINLCYCGTQTISS